MAKEGWTLGVQLKRWRDASGLRAVEVAAALGVSQQTVSNWEGDVTRPHFRRGAKLENLYGLDTGIVTALLAGAEPPEDAIDPDLVGMRDGQLLWSRRLVYGDEDQVNPLDFDTDVEAAIATDGTLSDEGKILLTAAYRSLQRPTGAAAEPEGA